MGTWLKRKPSSPGKSERSGAHELLPCKREQDAADPGAVVQELADGAAVEQAALDRSELDDCALLRCEPVDAGREQRLDRRRDDAGVRVVSKVRDELLDEQRVSLGGRDDAFPQFGREFVRDCIDELFRVVVVERFEHDERRTHARRCPARSHVEEVRARSAEYEDGRAARPRGEVFDEIEERGVGPVNVVYDEDDWARHRERLEEAPERPGSLVR
jgi:hypothetical protein